MDDRLVGDLRACRQEGLDELIHRHGAEIQAMAWMILRDASNAEEVAAEWGRSMDAPWAPPWSRSVPRSFPCPEARPRAPAPGCTIAW